MADRVADHGLRTIGRGKSGAVRSPRTARPGLVATGLAAAALAAVALAAGCASESGRRDSALAQIDEWLPGRYDNQAQIAADRRAGRPPHEALALTVVPVDALQVGHHVFYVEESAGRVEAPGTPRLILAQHLASIDVASGKLVAALYSFTDPPRWREGASTPELFTSLQPQDVKLMQGCELIFDIPSGKTSGGTRPAPDRSPADSASVFTASDDPAECQTSSPLTGALEPMPIHIELTRDEIAVSVQPRDARTATAADTYTRFRRSGGP